MSSPLQSGVSPCFLATPYGGYDTVESEDVSRCIPYSAVWLGDELTSVLSIILDRQILGPAGCSLENPGKMGRYPAARDVLPFYAEANHWPRTG